MSEYTKKELKQIQKLESGIEFNMARVPKYNVHESEEYKKAEELRETLRVLKQKAKVRLSV